MSPDFDLGPGRPCAGGPVRARVNERHRLFTTVAICKSAPIVRSEDEHGYDFRAKRWRTSMSSRPIAILLFLACISSGHLSYGQHIISDVPVSWIGRQGLPVSRCNAGQAFYVPDIDGDKDKSVVCVAQDGSTLQFQIPDPKGVVHIFAAADNGLALLANFPLVRNAPSRVYRMYHFDGEGKVVTQHPVSFDFRPNLMAVTSSGKTIVVGYLPGHGKKKEDQRFAGVVLDADDKVVQLFEFPPTAEGGNWAPGLMEGGNGVAYAMLKSWAKPTSSVATIGESGRVDINVLPVAPDNKTRHYDKWLFGPGVAVEEYHIDGETSFVIRFDEYDLGSGKRLRTKSTPPPGFPIACYLGDQVVGIGPLGDGDQQSTHRVTVKLEAATLHN